MDKSKNIKQEIAEVTEKLEANPANAELFCQRAALYEKMQQLGAAMNDYNEVLRIHPHSKKAATKAAMIKETLQYQNIDIYAATNLNKDPWEDD